MEGYTHTFMGGENIAHNRACGFHLIEVDQSQYYIMTQRTVNLVSDLMNFFEENLHKFLLKWKKNH